MSKKKKAQLRIEKKIIALFQNRPKQRMNFKQIAAALQIKDTQGRNDIIRSLGKLAQKKIIKNENRGQYVYHEDPKNLIEGQFTVLPNGKASIALNKETTILISKKNFGQALHGDLVKVSYQRNRKKEIWEGKVLSVTTRNTREYVGVLEIHKEFAFVLTRNIRMYTDFFIPKKQSQNFAAGDKVVVVFESWMPGDDSPTGKIIKSLGKPGEQETEIHAILHDYGLPYDFPKEVEEEATKIDTRIRPEEIKKRKDFRKKLTFTIDPISAKDFDDALSFEVLPNGHLEVGVHIADVSHYVQPNTLLEEEAYNRATSVYLVDRVVPMLPEKLSNGLCSLRPQEEKYTVSAVFEITPNGQVAQEWFGKTVILSDHRFSYEEVQEILETQQAKVSAKTSLTEKAYTVPPALFDALNKLNGLAQNFREKRRQSGALFFDRQEVNFTLDEEKNPVGVSFKVSQNAHQLVEELMLLANRKVAEFIGKRKEKLPFVYRVHDDPDFDKLDQLNQFVKRFGYQLNLEQKNIASSINSLLVETKGKKEQNLIDTLALRAMSKAIYTTQNIGHYGLSFDYYTHFTSPIRRYPDVLVHRLLMLYLDNPKPVSAATLEAACEHASSREQLATKAERDSIKYMQVVYMERHLGEIFKGVISGVTDRGLFVELNENKCEGMIRMVDLEGDYYSYIENEFSLIGQRTQKRFQLGDAIEIKVKKVDVMKRHLDFVLA